MIEIPTFIKAKNVDNNQYSIPKIIIQTYKNNYIHREIYNNINNMLNINSDYDYYLITDDIGRDLINKYFDKEILNAYDKLYIGAAKGDFLRYVAIYIYGGIYIDLDSSITTNLNNLIDNNMAHYIVWNSDNNIMNTPIISKPRNPLILSIIKEVTRRITNYESNIFLATGPALMTDVIYNDITNEKIYDVSASISNNRRKKVWLENENYKNGKIIHESQLSGIEFRMENYTDDLLYSNDDKYIVTFYSPTPFLYKFINIGNSETNSKVIKLDKIYPSNTELKFIHNFKDTFNYEFNNDELIITRTDEPFGWGQHLVAYL